MVSVGADRWNSIHPPYIEPHQIDHDHFTRFHCKLGAMDPNTKLLIDEMKAMRTVLERRIGGMESSISKVEASLG